MRALDIEVQRTAIVVRRCIALIEKARRNYQAVAKELRSDGPASVPRKLAARKAMERTRPLIHEAELTGWRAIEGTLAQLEAREIAIRMRGVHQPVRRGDWELARARAPFVREDCATWAKTCPEQIVGQYEWAIEDGDFIYAYLLEHYGQPALESAGEWDCLMKLRSNSIGLSQPSQDELTELERLHDLVKPLMVELAELRIPDASLFVQVRASADDRSSVGPDVTDPAQNGPGESDISGRNSPG